MQIYVQDLGWAGSIVVIADSEEEARVFMQEEYNYDPTLGLNVQDICKGMVWSNLGDC